MHFGAIFFSGMFHNMQDIQLVKGKKNLHFLHFLHPALTICMLHGH